MCMAQATKLEEQTIAFYTKNSNEWLEKYGQKKDSFWQKELKLFKQTVPSGALLEIGFGGALEAQYLINENYTYIGIDPVSDFVTQARNSFPQATFLQQTVLDLNVKTNYFDGFWCAAVLMHLSQEHLPTALANIRKTLKQGAYGIITLPISTTNEFQECIDEQTGRLFSLYTPKQFARHLEDAHFSVIQKGERQQQTDRPHLNQWATFLVQAI